MPPVIGFFDQIKQELVSARYLYYESLGAGKPHYSDRDVLLYNTLDYPSYSLAVEKLRAAFRITYSIFDKTGFFLNYYLAVGHNPNRVTFRNLWFEADRSPKIVLLAINLNEHFINEKCITISLMFFAQPGCIFRSKLVAPQSD